ncbi:MAG: carboxymuconolactone decarboxylase family protein [Rhodospirillales bacterium]
MASDQFERGLAIRKEVLGEEYVEASLSKADDFNRDFQNMVTEYCWGGSWGRGVLTKQQRSILNLGMLAALNRPHEFKLHFLGALTNGVGLDEIREVLTQIAIYCGIPAGVEAFRIAREVFKEEGIDVSRMDSEGAEE